MSLTKVTYSMIDGAAVNVLDYGADPTGTSDSTQAIKNALTASKSIWFPAGAYLVSETIRSEVAVFIDGEKNATIKAVAPFTGIAVTSGGSPVDLKAVFAVFKGTTINDISGARISAELEPASVIGKITIDCDQVADYGVFIERAPYTEILCNVFSAADTGIWSGVYCWGVRLEQNKILDAITNGVYLGTAANGVTLDNVSVWGYPTRTVNGIQSNGNNNGVFINGGFIERCEVGALLTGRPGSHTLTGIDFEAHSLHCVKTSHDPTETRRGGPINILNSYLDSGEEEVWNKDCRVIVDGCRFRQPATTSGSHYYADTSDSPFDVRNSSYDGTAGVLIPANFDEAKSVFAQTTGASGASVFIKGSNTGVSYAATYRLDQYGFGLDKYKSIQSGFLDFTTSNQGGANDTFASRSTWRVQGATDTGTPAALNPTGVVLESIGGVATFRPETDSDRSLGIASYRWSNAYAEQVRPGDGSPIWTSGSGSPEGAVTAPVGSLFTRTDGGAGTTLYVKESGTGNTGWVAK